MRAARKIPIYIYYIYSSYTVVRAADIARLEALRLCAIKAFFAISIFNNKNKSVINSHIQK
jgi:hypothetical protein